MEGGNHIAIPRLSKRLNSEMNSTEPLQEQATYTSINSSNKGEEKSSITQLSSSSQLSAPIPLSVVMPGRITQRFVSLVNSRCNPEKERSVPQPYAGNRVQESLQGPPLKQPRRLGSSSVVPDDTGVASDFQLAIYPVESHDHMENVTALMVDHSAANSEGESAIMLYNSEAIPAHSYHYLSEGDGCVAEVSKEVRPVKDLNLRSITDKIRKAKIAEGIEGLKGSVPCSGTSGKDTEESVLDDAIDYIKYLKLQMKLLSQSRLNGESTTYPFVHLEGYGHYLLHHWACNNPLEDVMGNLLEVQPQAAKELLMSKGLTMLPMDFAFTLLQATLGPNPT